MKELNVEDVKKYQVNILSAVDAWCRANHVKYFLADGTLLGAVRHGGYIPWDDDIDICMLRPDYERLIHEFNLDRCDQYRVLHSSLDENFPYEFAKVHDISTKLVEGTGYAYDIGVNIDVFVLDNLPDGGVDGAELLKRMKWLYNLLFYKQLFIRDKKRSIIKQLIVNIFYFVFDKIPMIYATKKIDEIAKTYSDANDSRWIADLCPRWYKPSRTLERAWFTEEVELEFEGRNFKAPQCYEEVLRTDYGDYMQLPPEEERVTHHIYTAYKR